MEANKQKRWNKAMIERLRKEYPKAACLDTLADDFGLSLQALRRAAWRFGVRRQPLAERDFQSAAEKDAEESLQQNRQRARILRKQLTLHGQLAVIKSQKWGYWKEPTT